MQSVFVAVSKNRNLNEREFISDEHWALLGLLLMFLIQIILSQLMGISLWAALSIASFSAVMWVIFTWQVSSSGVLIVHPTLKTDDAVEDNVWRSENWGLQLNVEYLPGPRLQERSHPVNNASCYEHI